MTMTLIAAAVAGAVLTGFSGPSQAASSTPQSCACSRPADAPKDASSQAHRHHGRHDDLFARFGGLRSLLAVAGSGQGAGGLESMLGGMGGGGFQERLGAVGGGGFGGAQAMAGAEGSANARQACMPDAMRLCSDAIPDAERVKTCMQAKSAQLSASCRAAMNAEATPRPGFAGSTAAPSNAGSGGYERFANGRGQENFGGQGYGNFEGGQGYDRSGVVRSLGSLGGGRGFDDFGGQSFGGQSFGDQGGMDVGRLIGMARSMGFSSRDDWRD